MVWTSRILMSQIFKIKKQISVLISLVRRLYLTLSECILTGVELRLRCCRWVMSGVLDVTLQRSEQRWWAWWAHRVSGLAEAERGQRAESEVEKKKNWASTAGFHSTGKSNCKTKFVYHILILPLDLRPSFPLLRTLAALRLLARKASVGVISLSTMLLSHGVKAALRAVEKRRGD